MQTASLSQSRPLYVPRPSPLVRQVETLLDRIRPDRLVVFVPRPQLGTALSHAVAQARGATAGLQTTTPTQLAADYADLPLRAQGQTPLEAGPRFFLTASVLRALPAPTRDALTGDQPLTGIVAPLARTFTALRTHSISPSDYRAGGGPDSARRAAQADAYAAFTEALNARDYYDDAALVEAASALVEQKHIDRRGTHVAIMDTVPVSGVEQAFVRALVADAPQDRLLMLGTGAYGDGAAPLPLAAARFPDARRPETPPPSAAGRVARRPEARMGATEAQALRFWTATGVRREVQAVLSDIVARERPLDTVEIAYTSPQPYLPLLDTLAERYNLPVSLSGGRALDATRPGQALRGFFDWVANGGPIPGLIALLRAGLLQIDAPVILEGDTVGTLTHRQAATLLAQRRYGEDPTDHVQTLTAWTDRLAHEIADLKAVDADWAAGRMTELQERRATAKTLSSVVEHLLKLAHLNDHKPVTLRAFASSARTILEEYEPTPKPPEEEEDRTPDGSARNRLLDRLQALQAHDSSTTYRPRRLARHMTSWLPLSPYVRAQRPQPGCVHVVPLESAGVANREHLYVVGLDAASTATSLPDDPLLSDEERVALSDDNASLPQRRAQVDVEDWRTRQALARHTGTLTLSASTYDLDEGEDLFEAPLFLRLKAAAQEARGGIQDADDPQVTHHALAPTETVLSPLDWWTGRPRPSDDALDDALSATYPWIADGLAAADARASNTYTEYDGLLTPQDASLDPLSAGRPVSAGRLERYARAPFAYFLRHVLDVAPLDEPALDDVAWLDAMGRGAVLHDTFRRFMANLEGRPTLEDEDQLERHFEAVLQERRDEQPPPSEVVYATTRRALWTDALLFLRVEASRTDDAVPYAFELGFGYPPHRQQNPDDGRADFDQAPSIAFGNQTVRLRGRVDRVDRHPDGTLALWDYKTGSSRQYDETDLLDGGRHLQWALYAYALNTLMDTPVRSAGYFFTSADEMGKRIAAAPSAVRSEVGRCLQHIADGTAAGAFPITDAADLRYSFGRLFHDYGARQKQLRAKDWPEDQPAPPPLRDE